MVRRHLRLRKKISGTAERPRLNVFRSLQHIYAQVIDDVAGVTLVSANTMDKEIKEKFPYGGNAEAAAEVGRLIAKKHWKRESTRSYLTAAATFITAESRLWLKALVKAA